MIIANTNELLSIIMTTTPRTVTLHHNDGAWIDEKVLTSVLRQDNLNTTLMLGGAQVVYERPNNINSKIVTIKEIDVYGYVYRKYKLKLN